ncbi:MAG TPA: helix-turn-helix transcriptional regulator [Thermoleophilaceae bacterium]|jgi:AraC family transcriptional regulator, regulatory protein of adaptative response / methylphosphotriester-DNA alkyltransferase methyltransferase|nr:helix-turn-helix transcriptional regulator [Thermoleophilaceae bacterium]
MRQSTVYRRSELYQDALRVIEEEYANEELSLSRVAHEIATSRRQLQRSFSEAGNTSFRRELQRVRMSRAAELLREGSLSVQEVAAAVGYRQAAQFAKAFRRSHGAPPSSFRGADVGATPLRPPAGRIAA